jgi:hypothetical protein
VSTPEDWQRVELAGVKFSIPPDARRGIGTAVDSLAGWFEGEGYRITFDLGKFGERLDALGDSQGFRSLTRVVAGRRATEVAFAPCDEPFAWARIVQLELGSGRTLTLRVSCDSTERCALADLLFESVVVS